MAAQLKAAMSIASSIFNTIQIVFAVKVTAQNLEQPTALATDAITHHPLNKMRFVNKRNPVHFTGAQAK